MADDRLTIDLNLQHGHKDLVQAVAFNSYGDRCATGSVDGKVRVFNRHKDATWRLCDTWSAHGGEVLELQWLPSSVYPNLIASLGIEGWFRLWAEDPSAPPGRRFCSGGTAGGRPAFDTRSGRPAPYRSFSLKHCEDSRLTYLALLATDGRLTVLENDQPENLSEYCSTDDFVVCAKPARGEEVSFKVRFDPNPEPCYKALKAGVAPDALALVVAAMDTVSIYRSRDVLASAYGLSQTRKEFYLAVQISSDSHRGLVRDVSWAPGNFRGYDMIATACQDGFARVFRLDTPLDDDDDDDDDDDNDDNDNDDNDDDDDDDDGNDDGKKKKKKKKDDDGGGGDNDGYDKGSKSWSAAELLHAPTAERPPPSSTLSASLAKSGAHQTTTTTDRQSNSNKSQVKHQVAEISRLDSHRTPVWRVAFDDDGQILGSAGDDGRLLCYRQAHDGSWAKSSELVMVKARMAAP
ncbi:hypothetical protein L249_8084 [Ophiocordyceps polyrhachis-furcata BCC 54312]|uniref:Uncharacterized protein n=1 Tax=Ophiocordyceps polyrhachis-furcata BCC 54312 TaxID=1330021 RepID=A0A367LH38_9HYPO|nr:hypothetical protein L249_8084 [Ophiocordyceps polyrhachis-furcata BCC 54312]